MGRKPNQLILEFFERGPKLEDASNRYQHTCKSCGEKFPKGRIDSLTNHLVKKCPALPVRDRQRAILQFHELPDLPDGVPQMATTSGQSQNTMNLPFAPKPQMSALETLAEVSRQHLDLSGKRIAGKQRRKTPPPSNNGPNFGSLDEFIIHDDRPDTLESGGAGSQSFDSGNTPALPSIYQFNGPLQHSPTGSPHLGSLPLSNSGSMPQMVPSNLVMAASAANELQNMMPLTNNLMEPELNLSNTGISDKFFHNHGRQQWPNMSTNPIDPMLHDHMREQTLPKDDGMNKPVSHPRPIAMNPNGTQTHFTTDFSMNQKPAKPKVRGRFSDSRRKEVQEVRKRGACIRCRMLKKPCSGESPCSTCVNVESARLWKQPCIRTRIAEEFNLYSAGLHGVLAFHAVSQARGQVHLDQIPGRIEATHHLQSGTFATFTPLKCQTQVARAADIDPAILATLSPTTLEIIDSDSDDIGGKLDLYIKKLTPAFYESEDSAFMKTTLGVAFSIISPNQDDLLSRALELWISTRILTSRNLECHLFSNPSLAPAMAPAMMSPSDLENGHRNPITPTNNSSSYDLIKMQLMGAIEKRAASLSRVVMNDLERRLLQRQQANPFETFLVAVILLACVERMCWLFRTWEETQNQSQNQNQNQLHSISVVPQHQADVDLASALQPPLDSVPQSQHLRHPKWPFDKPPAYYSQQGERFSDILYMLLKMRGVPPKPVPRSEDGMLVVWGEDTDEKVREWYEGIKVSQDLLATRASARFEGNDPREWELKWAGKIIGG
ncbi:uncharacterized protein BDR25DRAFT_115345 [Lindgomyces ingoldianus]|uniref:Uncharacterized protein n=1 Tax=Lindgomyces ingoldianus TaxID=673940 RepID=A0ACB6Q977_9PLEO|nr:uncharacterized protein BDR25DRAFT_115345 [Lindgomyces ingoldianus]KAF2463133.1 hypothetical protein BDR25DRAFT_115345 [Lindgomyces ingoldianus]